MQTFRPGQVTTVYPCQLSPDNATLLGATSTDCGQNSDDRAYSRSASSFRATRVFLRPDPDLLQSVRATLRHGVEPVGDSGGRASSSARRAIRAFARDRASSTTRSNNWCSNSSAPNRPSVAATTSPIRCSTRLPRHRRGLCIRIRLTAFCRRPPGTPIDWSTFRPILLYGDLQPHLRTQYSEQYNLTIQRGLTKDTVLQIGYVGSQAHRLLVSHDLNYGNPQTCLDLNSYPRRRRLVRSSGRKRVLCSAGHEDPCGRFHLALQPGTEAVRHRRPNGGRQRHHLGRLARYSSPNCQLFTGSGCPAGWSSRVLQHLCRRHHRHSNYNSLQAPLKKRFSRGLQFQPAYTWSKSFDLGSSFRRRSGSHRPTPQLCLSEFDARHRFVYSYDWELPIRKFEGFGGKLLNGWTTSGIVTFQTGFPIRITSSDDNELYTSTFFESAGEPDSTAQFQLVGSAPT